MKAPKIILTVLWRCHYQGIWWKYCDIWFFHLVLEASVLIFSVSALLWIILNIRYLLISFFFFYPEPNLSPSIFCKCRFRGPIQYLALSNIFLDNTATLRHKVPASKLFLHSFLFLFCWNKVYTFIWLFLILHMLLQHWPSIVFVLAGESVMLRCDSRASCTTSWSVCRWLVPPYHPLLFSYSLRCHEKWHLPVVCLFHMHPASPQLPVLHTLLYETHETCVHTGNLKVKSM